MNSKLSSIILFTYNRPFHTKLVLDALVLNDEAKNSILYIYCDGVKENADENAIKKIEEVRKIAQSENRFKQVIVVVQKENKGLANSIIDGVTEIVNKHSRVIVLEDDILVSIGFLKYMNEALEMYEKEEKVGCIHAWNYCLKAKDYKESTFFLKGADCWGWATWKESWSLFEKDGTKLLNEIKANNLEYSFNRNGTIDFMTMLQAQINNKNDSWAIRWHASLFLKNKYCLQPTKSIVKNIGLDNTGTHSGSSYIEQKPVNFIKIKKIEIREDEWFFKSFRKYEKKIKRKTSSNLTFVLKQIIPSPLIQFYKKTFLSKPKSKPQMWSGNYTSWEEAKANCSGYDAENILEKCKNALLKVKNGEAAYERDSVLFDQIQYSWGLLAGLQKATIENNNSLCVLDFGGSLGSTYFQNKAFLSSLKKLEWCIVEQAHFVDCGKQNFENEQLKFYNTIGECLQKHKPNVLLLSSVLQYLENPNQWIEKFNDLEIDYIIIDRTAFIEAEDAILTIQNVPESIYKANYPAWFFNQEKLIKLFTNFTIVAEIDTSFTGDALIQNKKAKWTGMILKKKA